MKTIGRILIILTVFAIVMGVTYVAVNASSSSSDCRDPDLQGALKAFHHLPAGEPNLRAANDLNFAARDEAGAGSLGCEKHWNDWHHRDAHCRAKEPDAKEKAQGIDTKVGLN